MWADAIRAALLSAGARVRTSKPAAFSDDGPGLAELVTATRSAPTLAEAMAAARAWLTSPTPRPPVPATALRLVALARAAGPMNEAALAVVAASSRWS